MKELWVKKTVYRRYLIEDSDVEEVKILLESFGAYKENGIEIIEEIENALDRNRETEYDEEKTFLPLTFLLSTPLDFIKEPVAGKEVELKDKDIINEKGFFIKRAENGLILRAGNEVFVFNNDKQLQKHLSEMFVLPQGKEHEYKFRITVE